MSVFPILENGGERIEYDYASCQAYSGKGRISSCPDHRYPSHWHDDIELSVILHGEMQYNVNGKIETVQEGEGFFINSKQLHFNYSEHHTECEYICVLLHPMLLCSNTIFESSFVSPFLANEELAYMKLSPSVVWQKEICQEVRAIYAERDLPEAPLLIQAHFFKIWAKMFSNVHLSERAFKDSGNLTIVKKMVGYVKKNHAEKITLENIASAGSVGQSKCCKLFGQYLNMTPNAYLNQCRLNAGRELLRNSELSVTEIAETVGYGSSSYFAESFRKWYGMSPVEYRKAAHAVH